MLIQVRRCVQRKIFSVWRDYFFLHYFCLYYRLCWNFLFPFYLFHACVLVIFDCFYAHFLFAILLVALFLLTMNDIFLLTLFFDALAYRVALVTTILERKKESRRNISNYFKVSFKKSANKVLVSNFTKYGLHRGCFPEKIPNLSKYLFTRTHKNSCS